MAFSKEQETLTWLSHWRGVEEVRQLAQAWNQLRAEKHWNRASQQANRPTRSVLNPTRETGESLTWMASWPDPFVTDGERVRHVLTIVLACLLQHDLVYCFLQLINAEGEQSD